MPSYILWDLSRGLKGYNNLKTISYVFLWLYWHLVYYCIADTYTEGLMIIIILNPFSTFAIVITHSILWMGR